MSAKAKAKAKRKPPGVPPCAGCEHRWGRHDGGIGRCSEPGCACASFAEAARRARLTPEERVADDRRLIENIERTLREAALAFGALGTALGMLPVFWAMAALLGAGAWLVNRRRA